MYMGSQVRSHRMPPRHRSTIDRIMGLDGSTSTSRQHEPSTRAHSYVCPPSRGRQRHHTEGDEQVTPPSNSTPDGRYYESPAYLLWNGWLHPSIEDQEHSRVLCNIGKAPVIADAFRPQPSYVVNHLPPLFMLNINGLYTMEETGTGASEELMVPVHSNEEKLSL